MSCRRGHAPDNSARSCEPRALALPGKLDALLDVGVAYNALSNAEKKQYHKRRDKLRGVTKTSRAVQLNPKSYDKFLKFIQSEHTEWYQQLVESTWYGEHWKPSDDRPMTQIDEFRALHNESMSLDAKKLHSHILKALNDFLYPPSHVWKPG